MMPVTELLGRALEADAREFPTRSMAPTRC